jgi:hypothetical protein
MNKGDIFVCPDCGLEIEVIKECKDVGKPVDNCCCDEHCTFTCCGSVLVKKS